tara:strand:- start:143 stop:364 length:222 start_codon:yes stop_codon:yes gene_type:complete
MACKHNGTVIYWISCGWSDKETEVRCGNTNPYGDRAICDKCAADPAEMRRIEQHEENIEADNAALRAAGWGEI